MVECLLAKRSLDLVDIRIFWDSQSFVVICHAGIIDAVLVKVLGVYLRSY